MHNSSLRVSVLIAWLLFLAPGFSRAHAESPKSAHRTSQAGQVVSISDIHFNPFYDPALIPSLIRADYHKWPAIFSRSLVPRYASHGAETNYNLLKSALDHIHLRAARTAC